MNCVTCSDPATTGIHCAPCNVVASVLARIKSHWRNEEIASLADTIRSKPLDQLIADMTANQAWLIRSVLTDLRTLAHSAKLEPDAARLHLLKALSQHQQQLQAIAAHDAKHGAGHYHDQSVRHFGKMVASLIQDTKTPPATHQSPA